MNNTVYIVAGDEMLKIMKEKHPENLAVPFREDMSQGPSSGKAFDMDFITARASFWRVSKDSYIENMLPVIELDADDDYILCFGEDDCCQANLKCAIEYLRNKGCTRPMTVRIVDELDLRVKREYTV